MSFKEFIEAHDPSHPALILDNDDHITWGQLRCLLANLALDQSLQSTNSIIKIDSDANFNNIILLVYSLYFCINFEMVESSEESLQTNALKSGFFGECSCSGSGISECVLLRNTKVANRDTQTIIIETSGTTGARKKIIHGAAALEFQAESVSKSLDLKPDDVQLAYMPLNYIYGMSIVCTWLYSGSVLVISNYRPQSLGKFFTEIIQRKISVFSGVPFTYLLMNKWGVSKLRDSNIRSLTQAGGYLPANVKNSILDKLPETRFVVMYGQTEFGGRISQGDINTKFHDTYSGQLLEGIEAFVDADGELYVSSPSICLNADEFMLKKILANKNYYSTRDIAILNDRDLSISGRNQNFIKVGGRRISQKSIISTIEKDRRVRSVFVTNGIHKSEKVLIGISIDLDFKLNLNAEDNFTLDKKAENELRAILGNVGYEIILLAGNIPVLNNGKFNLLEITTAIRDAYIGKKSIHFWM